MELLARVPILFQSFVEFTVDRVDVVREADAGVFNQFPRFFLAVGLHFELNKVEKRVGLSVPGELDASVLEQLLPHDVSEGVVFLVDGDGGEVADLAALLVDDPLLLMRHVEVALEHVLVN